MDSSSAFGEAGLEVLCPETWDGRAIRGVDFLVEKLVPRKAVVTLGGPGGSGKSTLALQMAVARALQKRWLGFNIQLGNTLFVSCEDSEDVLHQRLSKLLIHYDGKFADFGDRLRLLDRTTADSVLMNFPPRGKVGTPTQFYELLKAECTTRACDLVIIDSRYDVFAGDQIDTVQVHSFMSLLRHLAVRIGGAVVVLSHPSREGQNNGDGESGSVAWHNKVRSRLYLEPARPPSDTVRTLKHQKSNWGSTISPIEVDLVEGAFVRVKAGAYDDEGRPKLVSADAVFLDGMRELTKQDRPPSDSKNSWNYAPKAIKRLSVASGVTVRQLEQAMERLLEGAVLVVRVAKSGKRRLEIAEICGERSGVGGAGAESRAQRA